MVYAEKVYPLFCLADTVVGCFCVGFFSSFVGNGIREIGCGRKTSSSFILFS